MIKNKQTDGPEVYETFSKPSSWQLHIQKEPHCFNGVVDIRMYRITIEVIDEPLEVITDRLEKLHLECDNWHHWSALDEQAKKYNYTFKGKRGSLKKQRR